MTPEEREKIYKDKWTERTMGHLDYMTVDERLRLAQSEDTTPEVLCKLAGDTY